jgi:hypothetical protein
MRLEACDVEGLRVHLCNSFKQYQAEMCKEEPDLLAEYVMVIIEKDASTRELRNNCVNELRPFLFQETDACVSQLFSDLESKPWKKSAAATKAPKAEDHAVEATDVGQTAEAGPKKRKEEATGVTEGSTGCELPPPSDTGGGTGDLSKRGEGGLCICATPCLHGQCHTRDTNAQLLPAHVRLVKHVCHSSCHGKIGLDRVV